MTVSCPNIIFMSKIFFLIIFIVSCPPKKFYFVVTLNIEEDIYTQSLGVFAKFEKNEKPV